MINFDKIKVISADGGEVKAVCSHKRNDGKHKITVNFLEDCAVKEVILFSGEHEIPLDASFYGDGYQKLSQYAGTVKEPRLIAGYSDRDHYRMPQTEGFFTAYNFVTFDTQDSTLLVGAVSCNHFRTEFRLNGETLIVAQCIENLNFKTGDELCLEEMMILKGPDKNEIFKLFGDRIGENHPVKECKEFPVGWCSWYCIGPKISERKIFKSLKNIKNKLPEIKYVQIDDGFQPFMGDWLEVSRKFKRSMKEICLDIKNEGFEPAIWLAPFIASEKSRLLREHPEYFVKGADGKPLCCKGVTFPGWRDAPWYMLDGTRPEAREYIYNVVKTIYDEWGVKYFKLDANVWGALPFGERYDKNATCIDAYRMMMETFWEATGEDAFILGCNAPMWPSLGLVTGMRVTNDTFRDTPTMESIAKECFNRNWMHGSLWVNDPDCLLIANARSKVVNPGGQRTKNRKTRDMYKFNAIYIRASGGSILSGDPVKSYTEEDVEVFKKLISLPKTAAQFDRNLEVGKISYDGVTEYCIFNMSDESKTFYFDVPENFEAVDMYGDTPLFVDKGRVRVTLVPHSAEWIAIKEVRI